ncbi:MAG: hypothetical protein CMB49_00750 [Euryarchaeota archaeon]|nr:hypothetical protein [Euryarchaeota archaeon]
MDREPDRWRAAKVGTWVMSISLFFLISFFLAPMTLEEGSVPRLSGRANVFDYYQYEGWGSWGNGNHSGDVGHDQTSEGLFSWTDVNFYAAFIYGFGDLNCHQKYERSWVINGNQMPMCARDVGIFLGLAIGGWIFSRYGKNRWTVTDSFLSVFGDSRLHSIYASGYRKRAAWGIGLLAMVPIGIDGFTQMLTEYESTNPVRLVTGLIFGAMLAVLLSAMLSARPSDHQGRPELVSLPAGARFARTPDNESE